MSVHRIAVVPPDEQTVHQITEIKLLFHFLISFNNVCRYLLTVLSKQQLIQPLGYLTSSELLRSKAKSFFYVIDASQIFEAKSQLWCQYTTQKNITPLILYFVTKTHKTLVLFYDTILKNSTQLIDKTIYTSGAMTSKFGRNDRIPVHSIIVRPNE